MLYLINVQLTKTKEEGQNNSDEKTERNNSISSNHNDDKNHSTKKDEFTNFGISNIENGINNMNTIKEIQSEKNSAKESDKAHPVSRNISNKDNIT